MKRINKGKPNKKRKQCEEFTFEKHYGEPMNDEEQDELADLIASIIFGSLIENAGNKPAQTL